MKQNVEPKRSRDSDSLVHVVITGSECTGKTTLVRRLAEYYSVEFVPEFVREFVSTVGGRVQFSDHGPIARGQMELEDEYADRANGLLLHDTDLLSTVLYCRHHFGRCPEWIEAAALDRRRHLYLLCDIDIPWVPDEMRDRGDRREEMHKFFLNAISQSGARWELVCGDEQARFNRARFLIDAIRH